jgi:hypothetical protein
LKFLKNITKGWKTTAVGLVIIIAALISVFVKDITWADSTIAILIGLGLVFAPDDAINKLK